MLDNTESLHFLDVIISDGVEYIAVLERVNITGWTWPNVLYFDNKLWEYDSPLVLLMDDAEHFTSKAQYKRVLETEPSTPKVPTEVQYFIVGATWGGTDMLQTFLTRGYWQNGYEREKSQYNIVVDQMRIGDRIAVKRLRGQGQSEMSILALGIIKDIDADGYTVYVKWILQPKDRRAPIMGCVGTAYGPYLMSQADSELKDIFYI